MDRMDTSAGPVASEGPSAARKASRTCTRRAWKADRFPSVRLFLRFQSGVRGAGEII